MRSNKPTVLLNGLRDYGKDAYSVWGGDESCEHEFTAEVRKGISGGTKSAKVQIKNEENFQIVPNTHHGFCSKCNAWYGQLGLEPTFQLYIEHLILIFDEIKRILKPTGTCWVNLGDSYGSNGGAFSDGGKLGNKKALLEKNGKRIKFNTLNKSLLQIPSRFAIAMTDRGWILRNELIWHKRNCMPSSVKDRFTVDFEKVFFFTKSKKYYFEQQLEPYADVTMKDRETDHYSYNGKDLKDYKSNKVQRPLEVKQRILEAMKQKQGRNKRTVWQVNTKPYKEAHFATYPEALIEPMIKAGCPENGIVLDPFFGSGTTGVVALKQNKNFIGIELNQEYIEIAEKRISPYLNQTKLFNQ